MGMYDDVTCEMPMPDGRDMVKDSFQTKSLWNCMDRFTITAGGRLIFNKRKYYLPGEKDAEGKPRGPEHVADIDMDYHGDILILGSAMDGSYLSYAVRFTHGMVEWIRPFDSLPELHRQWLIERG